MSGLSLEKGLVQIYTGDGKGKTTAALGLALRASGAGLRSIIIQFMKGRDCSEHAAVRLLEGMVSIERYGSGRFFKSTDDIEEHRRYAQRGIDRAHEVLREGSYSLVILDEIVTAASSGIISFDEIFALISEKPGTVELILTGRGANEELIKRGDLVTEMKKIKHYYDEGIGARQGIED
jgi:cob(I)alamin adenosyltransferase